jgi:hypothetical protein
MMNTIRPLTAVAITADVTDKALPTLPAGTRAIVSYIFADRAAVIVQPTLTTRPGKGQRRAGLGTTGGKLRIVPLDVLETIVDGWQFFEPAGCTGDAT